MAQLARGKRVRLGNTIVQHKPRPVSSSSSSSQAVHLIVAPDKWNGMCCLFSKFIAHFSIIDTSVNGNQQTSLLPLLSVTWYAFSSHSGTDAAGRVCSLWYVHSSPVHRGVSFQRECRRAPRTGDKRIVARRSQTAARYSSVRPLESVSQWADKRTYAYTVYIHFD